MNLDNICNAVIETVIKTGKYIESERKIFDSKNIEKKGLHNFVTHVDKESEKKIIQELVKILPEAGFIAEEGTNVKKGERFNWVIDPLDGTTNFIHGCPPFAISVALMEYDKVIIGVVYEVNMKECFHTHIEKPAYLNDRIIKVSLIDKVFDSLVATGFPYTNFSRMEGYFKTMDYFMRNSHGLRRLGSAATDLAYVACGRYDAFYEYGLNPWDAAAGCLLVQQAGGKVSDFSGTDNYIFGSELIASNSFIFDELKKIIKNTMF
jgi:myo-inositol-1(or 4)-monophosphatase